jgi:hypothetical protein
VVNVTVTTSGGTSSTSAADQFTYKAPTTVVAAPALLNAPLKTGLVTLSATVTSPFGPVAGVTVTFLAGSTVACTATTNAAGTASCGASNSLLLLVAASGYTASFAGNSTYLASSGKGALLS